MEKHHHTIAILAVLFALLVGVVGGWVFFTLQAAPVQIVMNENDVITQDFVKEVFVNGIPIVEQNPFQDGDYWYDAQSGLYGQIGEPAFGVMPTGFDVPSMASDVSGGNTGIFFNGRELPEVEHTRYETEFDITLAPGWYDLDAEGGLWRDGELLTTITLGLARQSAAVSQPAELVQDERIW